MPSLAYRIEETVIRPHASVGDREAMIRARASTVEAVFIAWEGKVGISADEAMTAARGKSKPRTARVDEFLRDVLTPGPMACNEIFAQAAKKGFTADQLRGASARLRVVKHKRGLTHWDWELFSDA